MNLFLLQKKKSINLMKVLAKDSIEILSELNTAPRIEMSMISVRWLNITEKLHFTFATAQGCSCETKPVAFVPAMAVKLAATLS